MVVESVDETDRRRRSCAVPGDGVPGASPLWSALLRLARGLYWTLAFFAALRWLTQKALQDRQVIGQLHRLLTDSLHEGARVFVAMLTHHIAQRTHAFLGGGMIQAPL